MILEVDHPDFGPLKQTATAIKVEGDIAESPDRRGPRLGEDGAAILRELLGYSEGEVERLGRALTPGPSPNAGRGV
jgi:crotonobetainyl-CoA:carnitine CoA-transferase CaiB-like acyl-CoA transferase